MACQRKERTGSCEHHQCPFSTETTHGYECIDLFAEEINDKQVTFCEVGDNCLEKCPYSWKKGDGSDVDKAAKKFMDTFTSEDE